MATQPEPTQKSKVQCILEYIEANPDCTYTDVTKGCEVSGVDAFLIGYFKRGQVLKWYDGQDKKHYRLADGLTVEDILSSVAKPSAAAKPKVDKPAAATTAQRIERDPFKCAFTSEGTLMIFGLTPAMIELDKTQTDKLLALVRPHLDEVPV